MVCAVSCTRWSPTSAPRRPLASHLVNAATRPPVANYFAGSVAGDPALIKDHGDQTRQPARELGHRLVVPPSSYRYSSLSYDRDLYRRRDEVEGVFCGSNASAAFATRYSKLDLILLILIHLAKIWDALQLL